MILGISLFNTLLPILLYRVNISFLRWVNMMLSITLMAVSTKMFFEFSKISKVVTFTIFEGWDLMLGYDSIGLVYIWLTAMIFPVSFLAV